MYVSLSFFVCLCVDVLASFFYLVVMIELTLKCIFQVYNIYFHLHRRKSIWSSMQVGNDNLFVKSSLRFHRILLTLSENLPRTFEDFDLNTPYSRFVHVTYHLSQ